MNPNEPKKRRRSRPPSKTPENFKMPARICNAHRTNGQPCAKWAIQGGYVCATHGGSSPQVKAKAKDRLEQARQRLIDAADPVSAELVRLATGAEAETVRKSACDSVLDRVGISAKQQKAEGGAVGDFTLEELLVSYRRVQIPARGDE